MSNGKGGNRSGYLKKPKAQRRQRPQDDDQRAIAEQLDDANATGEEHKLPKRPKRISKTHRLRADFYEAAEGIVGALGDLSMSDYINAAIDEKNQRALKDPDMAARITSVAQEQRKIRKSLGFDD